MKVYAYEPLPAFYWDGRNPPSFQDIRQVLGDTHEMKITGRGIVIYRTKGTPPIGKFGMVTLGTGEPVWLVRKSDGIHVVDPSTFDNYYRTDGSFE